MQQSSVIFFCIFAAFIIYITQRGELPTYLGLLLLSPSQSGAASVANAVGSSNVATAANVQTATQIADVAIQAAPLLL